MELRAEDIATIRRTWARVAPVSGMAAQLFYGRLFRLAPETRALFGTSIEEQGRKLIQTLGFVVDNLDRTDQVDAAARALAIRHVGYGAEPEHYAVVGEALIWTLSELLGPAFGEDERAAWSGAYAALSAEMIAAVSEGHAG